MTARLLVLPAVFVTLIPFTGCSYPDATPIANETNRAPEPPKKANVLPEARQPSQQALADAQRAYKALGGAYRRESNLAGDPIHRFVAPTPLAADVLAKLPDLSFSYTLMVSINPKTPLGALKALAHLHSLRSISVSQDIASELGATITPRLAELVAIPNLERLNLDSGDKLLTDELAKELIAFPSLRVLAGAGPITDLGLEKLSQCPQLKSLSFLGCPDVTDAGLAHLATMPNLTSLSLYGPKVNASGFRHFTKEPRLTSLAIGGNDMKEDILAEVEKVRSLKSLNLNLFHVQGGELTEQGLAHIVRLPHLRDLVLPTGRITDAGSTGRITDAGLNVLADAPALEQLSMFASEKITDEGLKVLARLTRLKSLRLFGAKQLTDDSLKMLAALPELVSLDIDWMGQITEQGLRAFVAGRADKLVALVIQGAPVSDEFIAELAEKGPNLQLLNIGQCKAITDKSVPILSKLAKLRLLDVRETSITPSGADTLRQQLTDCRVYGERKGERKGDATLFPCRWCSAPSYCRPCHAAHAMLRAD